MQNITHIKFNCSLLGNITQLLLIIQRVDISGLWAFLLPPTLYSLGSCLFLKLPLGSQRQLNCNMQPGYSCWNWTEPTCEWGNGGVAISVPSSDDQRRFLLRPADSISFWTSYILLLVLSVIYILRGKSAKVIWLFKCFKESLKYWPCRMRGASPPLLDAFLLQSLTQLLEILSLTTGTRCLNSLSKWKALTLHSLPNSKVTSVKPQITLLHLNVTRVTKVLKYTRNWLKNRNTIIPFTTYLLRFVKMCRQLSVL